MRKIKLRTAKEITEEVGKAVCHKLNNLQYIRADEMIKYLMDFPSYHYSSLTINRECADANCRKIMDDIVQPLDKQEEIKVEE